jgi:hypothetical protein
MREGFATCAGRACRGGGALVSTAPTKPATVTVKTTSVRFMPHIIAYPCPPRKCADFFPIGREIWYTIIVRATLEVSGVGEIPVNGRKEKEEV